MADPSITVHVDVTQLADIVKTHIRERVEPLVAIANAALAWHDTIATPNNPFLDEHERALSDAVQAYRAALNPTTPAGDAMTLAQVMDGARDAEPR